MTPRDMLAALRRSFGGSALPEPSASEVYEGRLPVVQGDSLLDRPLGVAKGRRLPASLRDDLRAVPAGTPSGSWVPWCKECRLEPVGGPWPLAGAEHLARMHDIVHHGGEWTAEALPAAEVARLAAGGSPVSGQDQPVALWRPIDLDAPVACADHEPMACYVCGARAVVEYVRKNQHGITVWFVDVCAEHAPAWQPGATRVLYLCGGTVADAVRNGHGDLLTLAEPSGGAR
jgi:hypothetical protein